VFVIQTKWNRRTAAARLLSEEISSHSFDSAKQRRCRQKGLSQAPSSCMSLIQTLRNRRTATARLIGEEFFPYPFDVAKQRRYRRIVANNHRGACW
jgi:hypothetical protein